MPNIIGEVAERGEGVFEWTLRDFMSLPDQVDVCYWSPSFSFGGARWYLEMFPNGRRNKTDGYMDVFLYRRRTGPPIQLNYSFSLKTSNNEITEEGQGTQTFEMRIDGYGGSFLRRSRLLRRQSELVPSGHLTFVCRLKHSPSTDAANSAMPKIGEVAEREECVIEWIVRDFFTLPTEVEEVYISPSFSFDGAQWLLAMYPNGRKECKSKGRIEVALCRVFAGPPIEMNFSLGLKTSKNEIAEESHITYTFEKEYENRPWDHFLKRSTLLERKAELAPSGHLTIVCRLKHPPPTDAASTIPASKCAHCKETVDTRSLSSHERKCMDKPIQCPECSDIVALKDWYAHECQPVKVEGDSSTLGPLVKSKLNEDLKQLLQNQENCDVVLKVKGQEFLAHKAILTARSSVFASAFRNDMKEKATGVVHIEDCEPSTFPDFLRFVYCEDVGGISNETVFSLFIAADKYDVSDLREKCLEFMKENLCVDTFCDTLTLALRHSENELVRFATDFFVANADKIIVTVEWQTFAVENPTQSNELFIKFVSSVKH